MAKAELTRLAAADLESIFEYTLETWGNRQAELYLENLQAGIQQLADHPGMGRSCDPIRPGLKRMEHSRHTVFYRQNVSGILVTRILHQSMLPDRQILNE